MKKIVSIIIVISIFLFYETNLIDEVYEFKDKLFKEDVLNEKTKEATELDKTETENDIEIDNFKYLQIGDKVDTVLDSIGQPSRIDDSEYNFNWYVYNQQIEKFCMVGIENDTVVALYSNSIDSSESEHIKLNDNRDFVRENYDILEYKKKGNTRYIINSDNQYDIINEHQKYITLFYDIHEDNIVSSYQIISKSAEDSLNGIYPKDSKDLLKSFELQVLDLANSVRAREKLSPLSYSEKATQSSKKHSIDMRDKNFFDHINEENKNPFDRMKKEGIVYTGAGENIAAGQTSAIYAHEAWMNSEGHRKNILGDYRYLGVGIVFGGYYKTYYTQNFYI